MPLRFVRLALGGVLVLLFSLGCASFGKRLEPPEVSLVDLAPLESSAFEQRFAITLRIVNPNEVALAADGIDLVLDLNGQRLARALSSESFEVPRLGSRVLTLEGTTNLLDLFRQVVHLPESDQLDYSLRGRVLLADSLGWIRFSRKGSLLPKPGGR